MSTPASHTLSLPKYLVSSSFPLSMSKVFRLIDMETVMIPNILINRQCQNQIFMRCRRLFDLGAATMQNNKFQLIIICNYISLRKGVHPRNYGKTILKDLSTTWVWFPPQKVLQTPDSDITINHIDLQFTCYLLEILDVEFCTSGDISLFFDLLGFGWCTVDVECMERHIFDLITRMVV